MDNWTDVLVLDPARRDQKTIRRCFDVWRRENGIPLRRCDNSECVFHAAPLRWNNQELKVILDHCDGNRFNNRPSNLRYLCPNCNSQLDTAGGANRGRVESTTKEGYVLKNRDGSKIACSTGRVQIGFSASGVGSASVQSEQD